MGVGAGAVRVCGVVWGSVVEAGFWFRLGYRSNARETFALLAAAFFYHPVVLLLAWLHFFGRPGKRVDFNFLRHPTSGTLCFSSTSDT